MRGRVAVLAIFSFASVARAEEGASVHVEANDPNARVEVLGKDGEVTWDNPWIAVCQVPCDRRLDPTGEYHIGGAGLRPTKTFSVPAAGQLSLRATLGHNSGLFGGLILFTLGVGLTIDGGLFLGMAAMPSASNPVVGVAFGVGFLVVGPTLLIAGAIMMVNNATSLERVFPSPTAKRFIPGGFRF